MKRFNANYIMLGVLAVVLIAAGADFSLRLTKADSPATPNVDTKFKQGKSMYDPRFDVGDQAPSFTLADARGKQHKLAEFTHRDTLLFFACGCSNCKQVQEWMAQMAVKKPIPPVVTITTSAPEAEAAWRRDTGLEQTVLYATDRSSVMMDYSGKPCPRLFHISKGGKVKWFTTSMAKAAGLQEVGMNVASHLKLPPPDFMSLMPPGQSASPVSTALPVRDPSLPPYAVPQSSKAGP